MLLRDYQHSQIGAKKSSTRVYHDALGAIQRKSTERIDREARLYFSLPCTGCARDARFTAEILLYNYDIPAKSNIYRE